MKVLLIDDDTCFLKTLEKLFLDQGYAVLCLSHMAQIMPLLDSGYHPDVVICDYHLGENNGVEALNLVRKVRPHKHSIIMSGDMTAEHYATDAGFPFFAKSKNFNDLIEWLAAELGV